MIVENRKWKVIIWTKRTYPRYPKEFRYGAKGVTNSGYFHTLFGEHWKYSICWSGILVLPYSVGVFLLIKPNWVTTGLYLCFAGNITTFLPPAEYSFFANIYSLFPGSWQTHTHFYLAISHSLESVYSTISASLLTYHSIYTLWTLRSRPSGIKLAL